MTDRFGLRQSTIDQIAAVFARHTAVEKAVLYGSRAKGTHKNGSDIDLTLHGDGLNYAELSSLAGELDDLLLPYSIDLSIFAMLDDPALRGHIERVGKVFYARSGTV